MSDDDSSDIEVSPPRYSIYCNAVRTSKGAFTLVNPSKIILQGSNDASLSE